MPEKDLFDESQFDESSEVKANTIDWYKVGDHVIGTFVKARHNVDTVHGKNSIYELHTEKGVFHRKDGEEVTIGKGESWNVWGRNDLFNGQMNSLRPGQVIKLMFTDEQKSKFGNDAKIIKIFAPKENDGKPKMNQEWLETQGVTGDDF